MTKGPILQKLWESLPDDRKDRVKARADELKAEYLTLQELRKKAGLTQESISEKLDMPQGNVSRLEKNSDMLLSTLRSYVEAMGGKLNLTVELPNRPPIALSGPGDLIVNFHAVNFASLLQKTSSSPTALNHLIYSDNHKLRRAGLAAVLDMAKGNPFAPLLLRRFS
jgi:transcriptional regulator with XRE-family HTH domain